MKTNKLFLLVIISLVFKNSSFSQVKQDDFVEIPFVLDSGQVIVEASVKDAPAKMVLATTISSSIDFDKYRESDDKVPYHISHRVGRTNWTIPQSTITGFRLAEMKFHDLKMYWDGASDLVYKPRQPVDGILGYNFFKDRIVQINYPQKIIRIYGKNPYQKLIKNKKSNNDSFTVLKIKGSAEMPPKEMFFLTTNDILVNGKKVQTLIDINQPLGFIISSETAELLKPDSQLKTLNINTIGVADLTPGSIGKFKGHKKFDAILGAKFLQNYIVTIDLNKHIMVVEKP